MPKAGRPGLGDAQLICGERSASSPFQAIRGLPFNRTVIRACSPRTLTVMHARYVTPFLRVPGFTPVGFDRASWPLMSLKPCTALCHALKKTETLRDPTGRVKHTVSSPEVRTNRASRT